MKIITDMGISLTLDGLMLTFQCVEAADVAANRATKPVRLNFLLPPVQAAALGTELVKRAQQSPPLREQ